jgi:hypothetical protein
MTHHVGRGYRRHRKATWAFALALAALAVSLVPQAAADDTENYDACLQYDGSPACSSGLDSELPAGAKVELTLTVTNAPASETTLGSVDLSAPAAIVIDPDTAAYDVGTGDFGTNTASKIELRNLNLVAGASVSVTFEATASCVVASDLAWTIAASHEPDFSEPTFALSGTGLASDIVGTCKLVWVTEPRTTNKNTIITGAPYNPDGPAVAVGAEDALGGTIPAPSGVTLAMTEGAFTSFPGGFSGTSATLVGDEARFGSFTSSATGSGFRVQASAPEGAGFDPTPNSGPRPFSITLNGKACTAGQDCSVPTTTLNSLTRVNVTGTGGFFAFLGLGPTTIPLSVTGTGGGCQFYVPIEGASGFETAEERTGGELLFTYSIDKKAIEKRYGKNSSNRFIPLCAGAARLDSLGHVHSCTESGFAAPWKGKELSPTGDFTGANRDAVCDPTTGLLWGIIGSFQDKNKGIDPNLNPTITSWFSEGQFRHFNARVPFPWDWKMG